MTLQTKLPGSAIQTGTISVTAITNFSGELSASLPPDVVSSSAQVKTFLPTDTVSSSAQVTAFLPTGTVSSSTQVDVFTTTGGNTLATTGSNTFTAAQTISDTTNSTSYLDGALHVAGGMSVRQDVRISGSMTINGLLTAVSMSTQYVTSSQYNIGVSRITLNDDDNVRFAGISIIDSGSASPTSASIFWDSLQHRFIYENLSGSAYNSSIIIAGPKHTGSLGDEPTLTSGYIAYATGGDHIDNSIIFQTGNNIGIGTTSLFGKLNIADSTNGRMEFTPTSTGVAVEVLTSDRTNASDINFYGEDITFNTKPSGGYAERLRINASGLVGIGTTNPGYKLDVYNVGGSTATTRLYGNDQSNVRLRLENVGSGGRTWELVGGLPGANNSNFSLYDVTGTATRLTVDSSGNLAVDTNTLYVDAANNRVGIGTASPATALDVYGSDPRIQSYNSGGPKNILLAGGTVGYTGMTTNHPLAFITNDTERMRLDASGNLGIGTTSPASRLHVFSSAVAIKAKSSVDDYTFQSISSSDKIWGMYHTGNDFYIREVGVQTPITFQAGGNVGIGTESPLGLLHVNAADTVTGTLIIGGGKVAVTSVGEINAQLDFRSNDSSVASTNQIGGRIASVTEISNGAYTGLAFYTYEQGAGTPLSEKLRIAYSGNVGIGTTSPSNLLHLKASTNPVMRLEGASDSAYVDYNGTRLQLSAGGGAMYFVTGNSEKVRIDSSGNVGIGLTNPNDYANGFLTVSKNTASGDTALTIRNGASPVAGAVQGTIINFVNDSGTNAALAYIQTRTNDGGTSGETSIRFGTWNGSALAERVRISAGGNVGIGTTNPSTTLHVNGNTLTTTVFGSGHYSGFVASNISAGQSGFWCVATNTGGSGEAASQMIIDVIASSWTVWNLCRIIIDKRYDSSTVVASITGYTNSTVTVSVVTVNVGGTNYIAIRRTGGDPGLVVHAIQNGQGLTSAFHTTSGTVVTTHASYP